LNETKWPVTSTAYHTYRWSPPAHAPTQRCGIYLLHGTGEHAGRYEPLAQRLSALGFQVGAHDHPGHGRSPGKRGVIDPEGALVTQAAIQCQNFAHDTGGAPIVFGHSLGGVVATELALQHGMQASGLILSAPAFVPYMRKMDAFQVNVLARFAPTFTVERPYDATRLTQDKRVQQQAADDPLNHGFKSASLIKWLVSSGQRQLDNAHLLSVDALILIAGADPVVDSGKIRQFAKDAPAEHVTVREYDDSLHEILNETTERAERAFVDIEAWLLDRFVGS